MNAQILFPWLLLAAVCAAPVQAHEPAAGAVMVHDGWIRTAPPTAPVRAGYGLLMNHDKIEVVIDAARSDAFERVEVHAMHDVDGVMRMRPVPELRLAPFQTLRLEPGGMHLMLYGPRPALAQEGGAEIVFLHGDEEVARARFELRDGAADAQEHEHAH